MRLCRWLIAVIALFLLASPVAFAQEASELNINSTRYVVVDLATGDIFAQRGANDRVAIASLTKVFTAVQAMEMAPLDTQLKTSDFDLRSPDGGYFGSNGTLMGFEPGQVFTLEELIYGMLLPSGNDAAITIARVLGMQEGFTDEQAVQHFMDLLNQRIADMGLENTHLMNPHGWGVDDHYSSAADVAAFNRMVVLNYPHLVEIMGTHNFTTADGSVTVTNTNKSLRLYDSVIGGKTGYDWDSGYCLVNIAQRGDVGMIAVTLDGLAPDDWYDDNATLLQYGFEQQEALSSSGKAFEGDRALYVDPITADMERSAHSTSSFGTSQTVLGTPAATAVAEPTSIPSVSPPTVVEAPQAGVSKPGIGSISLALGTVVTLLALAGLAGFRMNDHRGNRPEEPLPDLAPATDDASDPGPEATSDLEE